MRPEAGGQSVIIRTRISHCDILQSFKIHPLSPLKFTASHFIQGIIALLFPFKANLVVLQAPPSTDIGVVISQSYKDCSRWSKHPFDGSNILPHNANKAVPVFSSGHQFLTWNLIGKMSQIPSFLQRRWIDVVLLSDLLINTACVQIMFHFFHREQRQTFKYYEGAMQPRGRCVLRMTTSGSFSGILFLFVVFVVSNGLQRLTSLHKPPQTAAHILDDAVHQFHNSRRASVTLCYEPYQSLQQLF